MIEEEYDDHLCRPRIRSYKVMKFTEFYTMKGEDGKTILNIVTLDGDDIMLEEFPEDKERTKIPFEPSNRGLTGEKNNHRPNSILTQTLVN